MRKLFWTIFIAFLFQNLQLSEVKAQMIIELCYRSALEKQSADGYKPVLEYLDKERKTADEYMRLFAAADFDESFIPAGKKKVWVRQPSAKPIEMTLTEFVKKYGQVNSYEFQDQYIAKIISSPITLDEIRGAGIWYAVSTDNPEGDNFYIQLETPGLKDSRANLSIGNIAFEKFGEDKILPWQNNNNCYIPKDKKN